ncbi:MAG: hypothetical protein E5X53_31315 [Mesorhizobium sp.]|uniref:hypothetical protein n=1 Tax=Mesorhizobium sp. TaxID=1871066 RepID=UPI00120E9223|nr:hypothetical protein [Mesorhizobium sp.]TIR48041.1 MAG: hypothetical protein E5X53_31315 [Mesorhizobium sp.]
MSRSASINFTNNTKYTMQLDSVASQLSDGHYTKSPPSSIASRQTASWESEGEGAYPATRGYVSYNITNDSSVKLSWDVPWVGENHFDSDVSDGYQVANPPQNDDDNPNVTFTLSSKPADDGGGSGNGGDSKIVIEINLTNAGDSDLSLYACRWNGSFESEPPPSIAVGETASWKVQGDIDEPGVVSYVDNCGQADIRWQLAHNNTAVNAGYSAAPDSRSLQFDPSTQQNCGDNESVSFTLSAKTDDDSGSGGGGGSGGDGDGHRFGGGNGP